MKQILRFVKNIIFSLKLQLFIDYTWEWNVSVLGIAKLKNKLGSDL